MLRTTGRYDMNAGKVRAALVGKYGRIVGPLLPFGCCVNENSDVL